MREARFELLVIRSKRPGWLSLRAKLSTTPPVKSVMASDVLPPLRAS